MTTDNGGPAFPVIAENGLGHIADGMTLRDYFAAKAIPSMLHLCQNPHVGGYDEDNVAQNCYLIADAMLRARSES